MGDSDIFLTQDGSHSIYSEKFGVSYHSKYGAIQETQHVFINAALRFKAVVQKDISILEIGFGTGLNALMSLLEAEKRNLTIYYLGVEAFPVSPEKAGRLNFTDLLQVHQADHYFKLMHDCPWNRPCAISPDFTLEKRQQLFEELDEPARFDIVYFDAFAPNAQPELWRLEIMEKMYKALKPEGILVTYCAKGAVKRILKSVGFHVESLKGPPGKREMTRALKI